MDHLHMPAANCKKARHISDDLKWGPHVGGTHDDHVGLQKVSAAHHTKYDHQRIPDGVPPMTVGKVREGQKPAVLKKS